VQLVGHPTPGFGMGHDLRVMGLASVELHADLSLSLCLPTMYAQYGF